MEEQLTDLQVHHWFIRFSQSTLNWLITIFQEVAFKRKNETQGRCNLSFWHSTPLNLLNNLARSTFFFYLLTINILNTGKLRKQHNAHWRQNKPPQNVPFWHVDCFELKVVKTQETQETLFNLFLNSLKEFREAAYTGRRDNSKGSSPAEWLTRGAGRHLCTRCLFALLIFLWTVFLSFGAPGPYPLSSLAQDG